MASSESDPGRGTQTRSATCQTHGDYESRSLVMGRMWSGCPACAREAQARKDAEAAELAREAAKIRHERRIVAAGVPARFLGDFRAFKASTPGQMKALSFVRSYVEDFSDAYRNGRGLVLLGLPGTGKTMLALAAVQALLDHWNVRYLTCLELVSEVRAGWGRKPASGEGDATRQLASLDLLVIDEVSATFGSNSEKTIVFDVIDRRYREMLPTIIVTNEDADGVKACLGDRAFDRIVQTSRWVVFDWDSYRKPGRDADD